MKREKRERLEAADWTFLSPEAFLELSEEEAIAVDMKLARDRELKASSESNSKQSESSTAMGKTELST